MLDGLLKLLPSALKGVGKITGLDILEDAAEALAGTDLSPEQKLELQSELREHEVELERIALEEYQARVGVIQAEATSEDRYVKRARPTFLYIVYVVIVFNFILLPFLGVLGIDGAAPIDLPEYLYGLFGSGYLGYAYFRSKDKGAIQSPKEMFGLE